MPCTNYNHLSMDKILKKNYRQLLFWCKFFERIGEDDTRRDRLTKWKDKVWWETREIKRVGKKKASRLDNHIQLGFILFIFKFLYVYYLNYYLCLN